MFNFFFFFFKKIYYSFYYSKKKKKKLFFFFKQRNHGSKVNILFPYDFVNNEFLFYLSNKIYCFSFINQKKSYSKAIPFNFLVNLFLKQNFKSINSALNNYIYDYFGFYKDSIIRYKNYRKFLIYKIKDCRKLFIKYFFFCKTEKKLNFFLLKKKNLSVSGILNKNLNIYNILNSLGLFFNYYDFKKLINLNIVYINGFLVVNELFFLNSYSYIISFFLNYSLYLNIKNNFYFFYKISLNKFCSSIKKKFYSRKINFKNLNFLFHANNYLNIELSLLSFTFVNINVNKKLLNYSNSLYINTTNIRTYNWLIVN